MEEPTLRSLPAELEQKPLPDLESVIVGELFPQAVKAVPD